LVALLTLTGCTVTFPPTGIPSATPDGTTPGSTPPSSTPSNSEGDPLAGTSWQLTALGTADSEMPVVAGSTVTLEFSANGQAGGNTGCNSFGGDYTVDGENVTFGGLVSTLMACADANVMDQEEQYLDALNSADRFALDGDQLTIWYGNDNSMLTFTAVMIATPTPTEMASTATPAASPTPLPTMAPAPTTEGNGDPSTYPPRAATRINFGPGETSANVDGSLAAGARDYYVLYAEEGQAMSIELTSPNNDVLLAVVGADGTPYKRYQNGPPSWSFTLSATQDYYIEAVAVGPATDYTLRVWIEPLNTSGSAERIEFAPGATSAERSGMLPSGPDTLQYVLRGNEGQTMTVDATSDGTPLSMTIEDPTGFSMIPEMREVEGGYAIGAQYTLPATGDYLVTLQKSDHTPSTDYSVKFTIE
ncbi:MAG: META domain-containing protein, partial [Caldilineaceae bacterium]|nr:META domain-containing protein [Caldilineaceae bacterium]